MGGGSDESISMTSETLKKALEDMGCQEGKDDDDVDTVYKLLFTEEADHPKIIDVLDAEDKRKVMDDMTELLRLYNETARTDADREDMSDTIALATDLYPILDSYRNSQEEMEDESEEESGVDQTASPGSADGDGK